MGVEKIYQYLKRKKYNGTVVSPLDMTSTYFEIDVLGTYFQFLRRRLTSNDGSQNTPAAVGGMFSAYLRETFDPNRCNLHFDGRAVDQKARARARRDQTRQRAIASVDQNLQAMESRSQQGKWTSKSVFDQIETGLARIHVFDEATKRGIREAMIGFNSHICDGEADTCLAKRISRQPIFISADNTPLRRVAVSSDSDLLIYPGVDSVLRRLPGSTEFSFYQKQGVVNALKLTSPSHLAVLGVVSANDYSHNIQGLGLARNIKFLSDPSLKTLNRTKSILDRYLTLLPAKYQAQAGQFNNSVKIFLDMRPTTLNTRPATNQEYITLLARFDQAKHRRLQARANLPTRT